MTGTSPDDALPADLPVGDPRDRESRTFGPEPVSVREARRMVRAFLERSESPEPCATQ